MEKLLPIYSLLMALTLWICTACKSNAQQIDPLPIKESMKIVGDQFHKWKNGEASFFDLLAEDIVWTVSGKSDVSATYRSKSDFMADAVDPIMRKLKTALKPELISLTADDTWIWLHFKAHATSVNGNSYENTYVWKMQMRGEKIITCIAFLDTNELMNLMKEGNTMTMEESKDYIGMWVTEDGFIRHELLPNNRYDEARGSRSSAYQGNYKVTGNHIDYKDDTGFTADGEFKEGILYHAGMILYKEKK